MAGTTHYQYIFKAEAGQLWKVVINDSTYAGADTATLFPDGNGFGLTWEGAGEEVYTPIISSEFLTNIFRDANSRSLLDAIIEGPESRFTVRVYRWITSAYVLYWQGFILQDSMVKPDAADNTDYIELTATDGFGLLKDIKYSDYDVDTLSRYTVNYWIAECLAALPDHTANEPVFGFASVWYEDSQAFSVVPDPEAADGLANTYVNQSAFLEVDDYGVVQPMSLYDIMNYILLTHNLQISQCNGRFLIIQQNTYTQAQTRVWWYDSIGVYDSTETIDLRKTMDKRFTGGTFNYVLPLKEVRTEYEYRQGIYNNNLLPYNVDKDVVFNMGLSTQFADLKIQGTIETVFNGSGGDLEQIQAVYNLIVTNGTSYLNLNTDGELEWILTPGTVPIYSRRFRSDYAGDQLIISSFVLDCNLPNEGEEMLFEWSFYRYELFNEGVQWIDVANTNTATHDDVEGTFIARLNTGIIQEGTQLFRAAVSNGARADLDLESTILGDGANKYSAGALFVNDTVPEVVESNRWAVYVEIGDVAYAINSTRVREMLALRRHTLQIYNGTFYGVPDFHKGFSWLSLPWLWTSIMFEANSNRYSGTALAVIVDRSGITVDAPLTKQDQNNTTTTTSTGSSTVTETHARLHNIFSESDHSGNGGTEKATPIDADSVVLIDSADSSKVKRSTIAHIKTLLSGYWKRTGIILSPITDGDYVQTSGGFVGVSLQAKDNKDTAVFTTITPYNITAIAKITQAENRTYETSSELSAGTEIYKKIVFIKTPAANHALFAQFVKAAGTWSAISRPIEWIVQTVITGAITVSDRLKILASGSFQIGNDTNNATFDLDGKIRLNGTATVFDDLQTSGLSTRKLGNNDPTLTVIAGGIYLDVFSGSTMNEVFFTVQLPHRYKEGSDIVPHVHWMPMTSPDSTVNVLWKLEYQWQNHDGAFSGMANTTLTGTGATGTVGYKGIITSFGAVTGTGKTISSLMICRLYRDGAAGADTYTGGAALLGVDMHYEIDSLGSDTEYTK